MRLTSFRHGSNRTSEQSTRTRPSSQDTIAAVKLSTKYSSLLLTVEWAGVAIAFALDNNGLIIGRCCHLPADILLGLRSPILWSFLPYRGTQCATIPASLHTLLALPCLNKVALCDKQSPLVLLITFTTIDRNTLNDHHHRSASSHTLRSVREWFSDRLRPSFWIK